MKLLFKINDNHSKNVSVTTLFMGGKEVLLVLLEWKSRLSNNHWLAKALSATPLRATALPRRRVAVGMVTVEPEAAVRTNPPAVVKATVDRGSTTKVGAAVEKEMRQDAMARTNKPITFMIKLLTV